MTDSTPQASSAKTDAIAAARALLKDIEAQFPTFKEAVPLAIGIDKQVLAARPDVEKKVLRLALRSHTQSTRYLKSMEKATQRRNLDGSPADDITQEQREHAAGLLRERFRKKAEAQRAVQAEARAEQRRHEKLQQLTEKFGRR